jgi:phage-related protein
MAFWGSEFIFNRTPSSIFNLYISSSSEGGEVEVEGGSNVEITTQKIFRRSKPYLLGVQQSPVLEFPIYFNCENELDAVTSGQISKWLFGHYNYKKLQIVQDDLDGVYFNCFLKDPRVYKVGNIIRGFQANVSCDSPFAWTFDKTKTLTYSVAPSAVSATFNNQSDDNYYLYPKAVITMNVTGGDVGITNTSDGSRVFSFSSLSANEVLTVDNDLEMITSSTTLNRLPNFISKKWLRFVPGTNNFTVSGNVSSIVLTYRFAKKVGG